MARRYKYLNIADRRRLADLYSKGETPKGIAQQIGVHTATIYHELERGRTGELDDNARLTYDPELAQRKVQEGLRRRGRRIKERPEVSAK